MYLPKRTHCMLNHLSLQINFGRFPHGCADSTDQLVPDPNPTSPAKAQIGTVTTHLIHAGPQLVSQSEVGLAGVELQP